MIKIPELNKDPHALEEVTHASHTLHYTPDTPYTACTWRVPGSLTPSPAASFTQCSNAVAGFAGVRRLRPAAARVVGRALCCCRRKVGHLKQAAHRQDSLLFT